MAGKSDAHADGVLNTARSTALSAWTPYVALLSTLPTDDDGTGLVELSGGAYARQSVTFGAPGDGAGSARKIANSSQVSFPEATADWLKAIGLAYYDAVTAGNLKYWGELLGPKIYFTVDPGTDTFTAASHGLTNNQRVCVRNENGALPGGLSGGTQEYYIINAATDTFKLSLTQGGAAVDVTSTGNGSNYVALSYLKTVQNGDTAQFATGELAVEED